MKNIKKVAPSELLDYIDRQMKINNKKQYEVLRDLGIDSRYIGKLRHKLNRQLKNKTSTLFDRIYFVTCIKDGIYTVKDVERITGYSNTTIRTWIKDYKTYGMSMLHRATGFSHI